MIRERCRRRFGVSFLILALGATAFLTPAQSPPAGMGGPELESFYVGTLYLGFAAARISCIPFGEVLPTYLVDMVQRDLATAKGGAQAARGCVAMDLAAFDRVAQALPGKTSGQAGAMVTQLYQDLQRAVRETRCTCAGGAGQPTGGGGSVPPQGGTPVGYSRGRMLGTAVLPGAQPQPTDTGVFLQKGVAYIVVGEGSVSLWDGQEDGCDSVYRYRTPMESGGGELKVWGQLRLVSPDIHLSQLIEQQTKAAPVYNPQHVYQAVVLGEGATLKAVVHDGGGYGDNHGALRVTVFEAVPVY